MPAGHPLIDQLARDHCEHLRWLHGALRGRFAADEIEDVLQAAYAQALVALARAERTDAPQFSSPEKASAWLRRIAVNVAHDEDRHRHGRRPAERSARPRQVELETADGPRAITDERVDVENDVVESIERERLQPVVLRALESLPAEHRQILKLRYGDNLEPSAIMYLQDLSRKQWEGRHTRALKAFARALCKLDLSADCGRVRMLLKRDAKALLAAYDPTSPHLESCVSCRAFARATRGVLSVMPLPLPIAAWKLDALDYFTTTRPHGRAAPSDPGAGLTAMFESLAGAKAAAAVAAALVAIAGATAVVGSGGAGVQRAVERPRAEMAPAHAPATGSRWAEHATPRTALERAARDAARRREAALASSRAGHRSADDPAPRSADHSARFR